jgi:Na+/melibiose symporter-like transporter
VAVLSNVHRALRSGTLLFYFEYYVQAPNVVTWMDNFGVFNGIGLAATIAGVMLSAPLTSRFGKRTTFRVCLILSSVLMAAFSVLPPASFVALVGLQVLLQLSFGPTIPILWAMMADVADYAEWKTSRQCTALAFASIILGLKLGFGVGGWLNGQLLSYFGYSGGVTLPPEAIRGIVLMISILPALALLASFCVMFFYRLDDRFVGRMQLALVARRQESTR